MSAKSSTLPVVVVRLPNWVGDVCMVLPSLKLLAQTGATLLICGKAFARPLMHGLPCAQFIEFTGKAWSDSRQLRKALHTLQQSPAFPPERPCRGLLFPDSLTSALTFWLAGISSLGYRDDGRSLLLKWPVHKPTVPLHAVQKWYHLTNQAITTWQLPLPQAAPPSPPPYQYHASDNDQQQVQQILQDNNLKGQRFVLMAPTATGLHKGQIKVWPGFGELARDLSQQGITVVTCPPAHERQQARQTTPDALMLAPLPLGAFAHLASLASLVVCNDSGVSHLSAIAGARQLTLFGVTDPSHTGPWSEQAHRLGANGHWPELAQVRAECLKLLNANT